MNRLSTAIVIATLCLVTPLSAAEPTFVENGEEMVEQILASENSFGLSRSFVVARQETRAITVRAKNNQGRVETVVVQVPKDNIDPAARMKVQFDVNSANLRPSTYPLLAELGRALQDERLARQMICIKGHTDSDGDDAYNLQLSFDRADSVLNYLQASIGIPVDTFQVFGYGESMPLVANISTRQKQTNRRVEVSLNCPEVNRR